MKSKLHKIAYFTIIIILTIAYYILISLLDFAAAFQGESIWIGFFILPIILLFLYIEINKYQQHKIKMKEKTKDFSESNDKINRGKDIP